MVENPTANCSACDGEVPALTTDRPRSLASEAEKARRKGMLTLPHMRPLTAYVDALRARGYGQIPDFDPLDGGTSARALFLFEKPGPKAMASGFISRNNNDQSAENTFRFMEQAQIPREHTCLWNIVPAWNGTVKVTGEEVRAGAECLHDLLRLLPELKVVVLVGRKAERASPLLVGLGVEILISCHPSPKNYALARDRWAAIPSEWACVRPFIV